MELTREDLDAKGCAVDGDHEKAEGLYLHAACHITADMQVLYVDGLIKVTCGECDKPVATIRVASREEDPWITPAGREWTDAVLTGMAPKMRGSALVAQLVPDGRGDVKFWTELGASIMYDKPILAMAFEGRSVPEKLRMIADEVVVLEDGMDPQSAEVVADAMHRVLTKHGLLDEE